MDLIWVSEQPYLLMDINMKKYILALLCGVPLFAGEFFVTGGFSKNFIFNEALNTCVDFNVVLDRYCYNLGVESSFAAVKLTSPEYKEVYEQEGDKITKIDAGSSAFNGIGLYKRPDESFSTIYTCSLSVKLSGDKVLSFENSTMLLGIELLNFYTRYNLHHTPDRSLWVKQKDGSIHIFGDENIRLDSIKETHSNLYKYLKDDKTWKDISREKIFFPDKKKYIFPLDMSFHSINIGFFVETVLSTETECVTILCKSSLLFSFFNKLTARGEVRKLASLIAVHGVDTITATASTGIIEVNIFQNPFPVQYTAMLRNSILCVMQGFSDVCIGMSVSSDILLTGFRENDYSTPVNTYIHDYAVNMLARRLTFSVKFLCGFNYE